MNWLFYTPAIAFLAWVGWKLFGIAYGYYREGLRKNQYRVHRSRWDDQRPVDSRDLMAAHWRMVSRK